MLEDLPRPPRERCLTIAGLPDEALPFFRALLEAWGYEVQSAPGSLMLVKAGHPRAQTPQPCQDVPLPRPYDLPTLWTCVESRFHATPRRHLRLRARVEAELFIDGSSHRCHLTSFSDAGGRLFFPRELVRGGEGRIRFRLGVQPFETPCKVIYVQPKRAGEDNRGAEVGVIFFWRDPQNSLQVQNFIVEHYLAKVRGILSAEQYRKGMDLISRKGEG